jgi:hypothetical protein
VLLDHAVDPRHEQHVAQTCLDRARAGEKVIRDRVTDRPETKLVAAVLLLEKRHDPPRPLTFDLVKIDPREG